MVAIMIKWKFIQDLPIKPHDLVKAKDVDVMLEYNLNDVLITRLMLKIKKDELQSRIDAMKMYGLGNDTLSSSRPELAKLIISNYIQKLNGGNRDFEWQKTQRRYINFSDIILHFEFTIPEFKTFYEHLKSIKLVIGSNSFEEKFSYNGIVYQFGVGGLHTKDTPQSFITDDELSDSYGELMTPTTLP